jgi:serine protease Do
MESSDGKRLVEYRVMRTDAAINHGNSGGALFNAKGELIGITNAKSTAEDVDNMGYALPITQVKFVMQNAMENGGAVKRAMLGIAVATTDSLVSLDKNGELVIEEEITVYEAPSAGASAFGILKTGDILKSATINGVTTPLARRFYLIDLLLQVRLNDSVKLLIERNGVEQEVTVKFDKTAYFTLYK